MATIPIFDSTNYEFWSVKMRTLFLSMDLWDTIRNGYNDKTNKEKQQKDGAVLSYIQQGVSAGSFQESRMLQKPNKLGTFSLAGILEIEPEGFCLDLCPAVSQPLRLTWSEPTRPDYRNVICVTHIDLRQTGENHLIVATLVATVAFTAGFTMLGGYSGNDGPNQGMAILTREAAFKVFMVTDTIAMSLSISAVLIHFYAAITNNRDMLENQVYTAAYLIIYAAVAMVLAFITGTYAVLAHLSGLAISVCVIGCLSLFFFMITHIIKKVTDHLCSNTFIRSFVGPWTQRGVLVREGQSVVM
ncbi:unnamed protein product [Camellia sinensis]